MQVKCIDHKKIAKNVYRMRFEKDPQQVLKPGQFMMLDVQEVSCFLKRPFSFSKIGQDCFEITYQVLGKGTQAMTAIQKESLCDVLLPLGNGFPMDKVQKDQAVLLIAGGLGLAPLLPIIDVFDQQSIRYDLLVGFESPERAFGLQESQNANKREVFYMPDTVLESKFEAMDYDYVFVCGPEGMYEALTHRIKDHKNAYLSLEVPMACGTGLCSGCVKKGKRVCYDGPVYHVKEYYNETT